MSSSVYLTDDAAFDLELLYNYIAQHDAPQKAEHVLKQIEKALLRLSSFPERGTFPKELQALGIRDFREIYFKPYRIIYHVIGNNVFVMLIADGRRDLQALLQQRLINSR